VLLGWVVREAVTNVVRHSGARRCEIVIEADGERARLTVTDDGDGTRADGGADGTGLRGLAERLAAADGALRTGRGDGGGFEVVAELPVREPAAAAV
jgi:two-component system sensor histidine kinase DesK